MINCIHLGSWPVPPLFQLVRQLATRMETVELYRTVNMGVGMVIVADADHAESLQADLGEESWQIGTVVAGERQVRLV